MSQNEFDLVVIGSGPGGYVGAIRASQLGLKTAIVEKDKTLGGTCLNVGCIPSKALLESSEHFSGAKHDYADHGLILENVRLDLQKMMNRKSKIVKELTDGVAYLMNKNKVKVFSGSGRLVNSNTVEVKKADGSTETLAAKNVLLATGSVPNQLPFLPVDQKKVVDSTGALSLESVPKNLIVIGGGYIGLELGSVWLRLGSKVMVLEYSDRICGTMDADLSKRFLTILKKQGMEFALKAKVVGAKFTGSGISVEYEDMSNNNQKISIDGDVVLVSTGRRPFSDGLGLEELGIEKDKRGYVVVDKNFRTKFSNVYAIGDLINTPMLAHVAEEEAVAAAETMSGGHGHVNYDAVPGIVYTWPEFASVGQTEEQLKASAVNYKVGKFPFSANGRAKALGSTDGQVKVLAHAETDRLLGVHILGPRAGDLIEEAVVAIEFGGAAEDLARSFHGHPTLSEVVREAALDVDKRARQS